MKVTVIVASSQRSEVLRETVHSILRQSLPPDEILISISANSDCDEKTRREHAVRVVFGPNGIAHQRNTGLDHVSPDTDITAFFDDDVELHPEYLQNCLQFFAENPDVVALSGALVADGTLTGEISRADAIGLVSAHRFTGEGYRIRRGLYGCNMAIRTGLCGELRFDEGLGVYALFEDRDFGIRCARKGKVVSFPGSALVHLSTRSGRISSRLLGFTQVMNPYYLWRKNSFSTLEALQLLCNVVGANLFGLVVRYKARPRSDRFQQTLGNVQAVREIMAAPSALHSRLNVRRMDSRSRKREESPVSIGQRAG